MTSTKCLTAVERARRKKIRAMIRDAKMSAKTYREEGCRMIWQVDHARLLDELAGVAELQAKIDRLEAEANGWARAAILTANEIVRLKAEKAELVEACEAALRFMEVIDQKCLPEPLSTSGAPLTMKLRAAIAKAEPTNPTTPERKPGMAWPGLQTGQGME